MPTLRLFGRQMNSRSASHDHRLLAEKNIAGVGSSKPGDHAQCGGLAAAARAEQCENLAVQHVEGKILTAGLLLPG